MPTYPIHLPPPVPGATNRRLIVKSKGGLKISDNKFGVDCTFSEVALVPEGKLILADDGILVAELDIPRRPGPMTVPPRPQDIPPEPEQVAPEPVVPKRRKPHNLIEIALKHVKR